SSTAIVYLFCSGPVSTLCSAPVQVSCGSIPHIPGASLPCRSQFRQIGPLAIDLVFRFVSNERQSSNEMRLARAFSAPKPCPDDRHAWRLPGIFHTSPCRIAHL